MAVLVAVHMPSGRTWQWPLARIDRSVWWRGYIVLFEIVGDHVIVGAVRHQREDDYRH
jgi:hypothetical protein